MISSELLNPNQKPIFGLHSYLAQNSRKRVYNEREGLPKAWVCVCMTNRRRNRRGSPEKEEADGEE